MQTDKEYAAGHYVTDAEYLSHYQAYLNQPNRRDYLRYLVQLFGDTNSDYLERFLRTTEAELRRHERDHNTMLLGFDDLLKRGLNDQAATDQAVRGMTADLERKRTDMYQVQADVRALRMEQQAQPVKATGGRSFASTMTDEQLRMLYGGLVAQLSPLIHPATEYWQFEAIFRGKPLAEIEPVVWLKTFHLLEEFLTALCYKKYIEIPVNYVEKYKGCFYYKKRGNKFKNIRQQKSRALNVNMSKKNIESLITVRELIASL